MSDPQHPRTPKRITAIILGVLVLVIAGVAGMGVLASATRAAAPTTPAPTITGSAVAVTLTPTPTSAATATARPTASPTSTPTKQAPVSTPQPTKTATISKPTAVPIKKELTATVVKSEAVTGKADGPGEIGGPSVRFTITITNTTGASIPLSSTVVNAYYGSDATPAVQLRMPGGVDFPATVADGASATGVFVFNIPNASRSDVKVTVDTSVRNPVIAFQGSTPRG